METMGERATERDALERSIDLHARAAEALPDGHGDEHRALIVPLNRLMNRLRAASTDAPTEECDHRRQWCDLVPPGSGTISCRDCGAVLFNRYGPNGDKIPDADAAPDRGGELYFGSTPIEEVSDSVISVLLYGADPDELPAGAAELMHEAARRLRQPEPTHEGEGDDG